MAPGFLLLVFGAASAAASAVIVHRVRAHARRSGWLDVPTPRSSHLEPTPLAGGLGFVLPVLAILLGAPAANLDMRVAWPAAASLAAVAWAGWRDDRSGLSIPIRLAVHAAAGCLLSAVALQMGIDLGLAAGLAFLWWAFWTVAAINVVNFMDGTDGLIGLQGMLYCAFATLALVGADAWTWAVLAATATGAAAGFLIFNWPPASIFMGDVGSGMLGALFVLLGIATIGVREWTLFHAFLPLAPLFIDEVLTMGSRLSRGERLWVAHRSHVYQRLARAGWPHGRVALLYAGLALPGVVVSLALPRAVPPFFLSGLTILVASTAVLVVAGHRAGLILARSRTEPPAN